MVLPNFIIIGAGRSGTTSLYSYLGQHPDVYTSPVKEPGFFAHSDTARNPSKPALQPARQGIIDNLSDYAKLFTGADGVKAIGEATPSYMFTPGTAARIHSLLPDVRLIAVLRNPVDRAFASYLGFRRDGRETRSFEELVRGYLPTRPNEVDNQDGAPSYFLAGLYHRHLTSFMREFARDQFHVFLFDDLKTHAGRVLEDVCRFLEIDHSFEFDTAVRYNASGVPRSALIERLTGKNPLTLALKARLPKWIRDPAYRFAMNLRNANLDRLTVPPALRTQLVDFYREDILNLQELLERDLEHWLVQPTD